MDNRLFNINGENFYQFKLALQLLLSEKEEDLDFNVLSTWGRIGTNVRGYKFNNKKGLILYWHLNDNKGVTPIEELIVDSTEPKIKKLIRKYKLALLNDDIKNRVGIPFELLVYSLWNWFTNFKGWNDLEFADWEENADHDGSNSKGFRIYTEDWGRINGTSSYTSEDYSIGAIKPVYLWYGK